MSENEIRIHEELRREFEIKYVGLGRLIDLLSQLASERANQAAGAGDVAGGEAWLDVTGLLHDAGRQAAAIR